MNTLHGPSAKTRSAPVSRRERGISLIESLVALLILALGLLGLAAVQSRLIVETRTANARAVAVGLIDDLKNRLLINRNAAFPPAGTPSPYLLAWGTTPAVGADCAANACTLAQVAQFDLSAWRAAVSASLPGGDASVFASATDPRQLGVAVAWSANEGQAANNDASYTAPFAISAAANGVDCPANAICHLVYVQP